MLEIVDAFAYTGSKTVPSGFSEKKTMHLIYITRFHMMVMFCAVLLADSNNLQFCSLLLLLYGYKA